MTKRKLRVAEILNDIRTGMDDQALMRKYDLSATLLRSLFKRLVEVGMLEQADLNTREVMIEPPGEGFETGEEHSYATGGSKDEEAGRITLTFEAMKDDPHAGGKGIAKFSEGLYGQLKELVTKPHTAFLAGALATLLIAAAAAAILLYSGQYSKTGLSGEGTGSEINAVDKDGVTPLMKASLRGRIRKVEWLLENGANVNAKDKDNETALMAACFCGHPRVVRLLLDWGADVNARSKSGKTALNYAVERGNTHVADILMMFGAKR